MRYFSMLLVLCMLAVWIFLGVSQIRVAIKDRGARRWLTVLAAALIMIGALGFFGTALSALGALSWLPASFEWPIGLASGVVTTGDRYYVVPHTSSGRVQVYDRDWKFLRGWSLVSGGTGGFKLYVTDTNHVHVVTLRGRMHYTYDLRGKLLTSENYADIGITYASFPDDGVSCDVPTPIWLWFFRVLYFRGSPQWRECAFSLSKKRNLRATAATRLISSLAGSWTSSVFHFRQAEHQRAAESPKLRLCGAAPQRPANFKKVDG